MFCIQKEVRVLIIKSLSPSHLMVLNIVVVKPLPQQSSKLNWLLPLVYVTDLSFFNLFCFLFQVPLPWRLWMCCFNDLPAAQATHLFALNSLSLLSHFSVTSNYDAKMPTFPTLGLTTWHSAKQGRGSIVCSYSKAHYF